MADRFDIELHALEADARGRRDLAQGYRMLSDFLAGKAPQHNHDRYDRGASDEAVVPLRRSRLGGPGGSISPGLSRPSRKHALGYRPKQPDGRRDGRSDASLLRGRAPPT